MFWGNLSLQWVADGFHSSGHFVTQGAKWIARAKAQYQAAKLMIYGHFVEKHVTRISRTLQLIPQVLRDTLC
jgi:hypothetical protein